MNTDTPTPITDKEALHTSVGNLEVVNAHVVRRLETLTIAQAKQLAAMRDAIEHSASECEDLVGHTEYFAELLTFLSQTDHPDYVPRAELERVKSLLCREQEKLKMTDEQQVRENLAYLVRKGTKLKEELRGLKLRNITVEEDCECARKDRDKAQSELAQVKAERDEARERLQTVDARKLLGWEPSEFEDLQKERDQLRSDNEALNGKLTAAILGNEEYINQLRTELKHMQEHHKECIDNNVDRETALRAELAKAREERDKAIIIYTGQANAAESQI